MSRAEFISDERKLNLQPNDIFDRIINLKIHCAEKDKNGNIVADSQEAFVIRSDYELVYPDTSFDTDRKAERGRFIIRRCTQKPSIKVQCKMVTSNVGTSIGITVSNFFMLSADGKHLKSFNASKYVITAVEIVMGYWGQLKDSIDFTKSDEELLQNYFTLLPINGADKISITNGKPIVVTTEKFPPESAIHIQGFVADIYSSPVAISKITTPVKALEKPVATSGTDLAKVLFENVTKRYVSGHRLLDKMYEKGDPQAYLKTQIPLSAISDGVTVGGKKIDVKEGVMSDTDAKNYGVKVYLSEGAKSVHIRKMYDKNDNEIDRRVYFEAGWTIGQTIARIVSYMDSELDFTFSLEGDVLIYKPEEMQDIEKLHKSYDEQDLYKQSVLYNKELYNNRLPAVTNINVDAVATITCPFFTFLQPFQYVEFASRYALTSLVSYYADYAPTIYRFLVINATISFATVDDVNEVHITAVSARNVDSEEKQ